MLDSALKVNRFLLGYLRMLLADVPDERLAEQPVPGVNPPAWILGHLAFSADRGRWLLGLEPECPADWPSTFGPGSKPLGSRGDYPTLDVLLKAVEDGFEHLRDQVVSATADQLAQPNPHPRMNDALPMVQDGLDFLLTGHLGVHLGQLATWRRMIGMAPLF